MAANYTQAWLEDPTSIRGILVEIGVLDITGLLGTAGAEATVYLSNIGYMSSDASISYLPYLTGSISTTESLSIDNTLSMSFGDIEISNPNGELDTWLDSTKFVWANRPIQVYYGDPRWSLTNLAAIHDTTNGGFEKVFDGIVFDIDSSSREVLNIKVRDKLQRLNEPISSSTLGTYGVWGGGQTNQDSIKPLVFGEVFNLTPMLIDPSTLEYQVNDGNTELILEIRDNGAPIYTDASIYTAGGTRPNNATITLSTGKFKLTNSTTGTITASVQGIKNSIDLDVGTGSLVPGVYSNNIANIISLITTQYGPSVTRLAPGDLDLDNFYNFSITNTRTIGTAITDRANILSICQDVLSSAYAQLYFNRKGLLQILQLGLPTADATVYINDSNILHHSLSISSKTEVVAATKVGYCRNYSVQNTLAASLPTLHNSLFTNEWNSETVVDSAIQTKYKVDTTPVQKDTCLITQSGASSLATRLNNYFKVPKTVYKFTGTASLLSLKLGQRVNLTHNRFGLSAGVLGQVISLSPNWKSSTVEVEVII